MSKKPIAAGKSSFDLIDSKKLFHELALQEGTIFFDVACGKGTYSIKASEHVGQTGRIYAFDLWKEGIDSLHNEIASRQVKNIIVDVVDISDRVPLADSSVDVCLMATVLHDLIQDGTDQGTMKEVLRVMKPSGKLAVVEFKKIAGPPGPPLEIRLSAKEVEQYLRPYSFHIEKTIDVGPYNYLSVFANRKAL